MLGALEGLVRGPGLLGFLEGLVRGPGGTYACTTHYFSPDLLAPPISVALDMTIVWVLEGTADTILIRRPQIRCPEVCDTR